MKRIKFSDPHPVQAIQGSRLFAIEITFKVEVETNNKMLHFEVQEPPSAHTSVALFAFPRTYTETRRTRQSFHVAGTSIKLTLYPEE